MECLDASFYDRDPVEVAPQLLGMTLIGRHGAGVIVEVEAYHESEPACHAFKGKTKRTHHLFGPPGTGYIYFTYGMHWCFNAVCEDDGIGAAVLIRALAPAQGFGAMRKRRQAGSSRTYRDRDLCSGPAKLVQALDLRPTDNGCDLTGADCIPRIVDDPAARALVGLESFSIANGPRIGISKAIDLPWRFGVVGSPYLSKPIQQL